MKPEPPRAPLYRIFARFQPSADNLTIMPVFERQHLPISARQSAAAAIWPLSRHRQQTVQTVSVTPRAALQPAIPADRVTRMPRKWLISVH